MYGGIGGLTRKYNGLEKYLEKSGNATVKNTGVTGAYFCVWLLVQYFSP